MADLGLNYGIKIKTDSTAAKGIVGRRGLGKVRHIEVAQLWVQEKVRNGDLTLNKVHGKVNQSDCLTKFGSGPEIEWQLAQTNQVIKGGRHSLCPETV